MKNENRKEDHSNTCQMQSKTLSSIGSRYLAGVMLLLLAGGTAGAAKRPNIVVLFVDDLGYKDIGCYDGPIKTPALDRLATGGVRFTDFDSGSPVCSSSRATLLTGRHHIRAGINSVLVFNTERMHFPGCEVTLPEVQRNHGYATAHFSTWHLGLSTAERPNKALACRAWF